MNEVLSALFLATSIGLAPVPAEPPPDPLGWGYLGVRVDAGSLTIASVDPSTPAARAGIQAGDEFIKVGELKPKLFEEVSEHICTFRPGSVLRVEVRRSSTGETKVFTVRLGVRPPEAGAPSSRSRQRTDPPADAP
ncbi:PDZ domain-containing protein [Fimbriiglobus ruber]|uniref:PDZ domain-containing protein n=1 Tax=Fimbriiglobus ruber TaxID=1908690 RepID=A0A225E9Y9_9BACT|nr:PDZ domain-containing protein [Fimbriiglobus ruber]OWK45237.1 hypothetical protein FRUB_01568 [Fimbriiglobus ruber]